MAGTTKRQVIAVAPAQLVSTVEGDSQAGATVWLNNPSGNTATVFWGFASTITAGTTAATDGFPLIVGATQQIALPEGEAIYAVVATATQTISIAEVGV